MFDLTVPGVRRSAYGVLVAAVLAVAGVAFAVHAQGRHGPGMGGPEMDGRGGAGHGMMMFGGPPEHIARLVDRMLDGLSATDAQRAQIKQIAMSAAADLKSQREAGRGLQATSMQIFSAPNVDPAAAESLRQKMLAQHDQASKRVLQAMLDVSKVLTPEQRVKIGERMQQRDMMMRDRMQRERRDRPTQ